MDATGIAELDRRCEALLDGLEPLLVAPAARTEEVLATQRLRFETAVARGWARAEDHPDGLERDGDDGRAIHLVCRDGARMAGSVRLVVADAPGGLPLERDHGVRPPGDGPAIEMGRLVVTTDRRGPAGVPVVAALFAAGWLHARRGGVSRVVAAAAPPLIALYRALGLRLLELGPPIPLAGEDRVPFMVVGADDAVPAPERGSRITRRALLAGSVAAAGGLAVVGVPSAVGQGAARGVGTGPTDRATLGLIARVTQEGRELTALGHLTRVRGLPPRALFTRTPATSTNDPAAGDISAARFAVVVSARIRALSALGSSISATGSGTATIHLLAAGGARLDDPSTFALGPAVCTFEVVFQNDLGLDGPDNAAVALLGELTQRRARAFALDGRRMRIGGRGLAWTLRATGRGVRTEPTTPRSTLFVSGGLAVIDAEPVRP